MTASGYSWGGEQSHLTSTTTKFCGCFQQTKPSTAQSSAGTGQSSGQSLHDWQHHTKALSSYPICQIECSQTTVRGNAVMSAAERFTLEELRIQSIAQSHGLYPMEQQVFQNHLWQPLVTHHVPLKRNCHAASQPTLPVMHSRLESSGALIFMLFCIVTPSERILLFVTSH